MVGDLSAFFPLYFFLSLRVQYLIKGFQIALLTHWPASGPQCIFYVEWPVRGCATNWPFNDIYSMWDPSLCSGWQSRRHELAIQHTYTI